MAHKKNWKYKKAQLGEDNFPARRNYWDDLPIDTSGFYDKPELTMSPVLGKKTNLVYNKPKGKWDLGAMGDSINLSGDGGIFDILQFADSIGGLGEKGGSPVKKGFAAFNPLARLVTNVANKLTEIKNRKNENQQYLESLQPIGYENFDEQGLNNNPIFTKYGGGKKKKVLSTYNTGGLTQPILAEAGELYMTPDSRLKKIPDSADTHDDASGGEIILDADRVLEDTSATRKDYASKMLKLTPDIAESLTGLKFKKDVSHSQAMEAAFAKYGKQADKINKKIKLNLETLKGNKADKYATNSMDLNMDTILKIPTSGSVFDDLFEHQELIKQISGIEQERAKFGGKYMVKAQTGFDRQGKNLYGDIKGWTKTGETDTHIQFKKTSTGKTVTASKDGKQMSDSDWIKFINTPQRKAQVNEQRIKAGQTDYGFQLKPIQPIKESPISADASIQPRSAPDFNITTSGAEGSGTQPNRFNFINQPKSEFNEPLNWYDAAGPLGALLDNTRIPNRLNPAQFNQIRLKLQNPLPTLQAGQSDYSSALKTLPNNGVGYSNLSDLYSKKYGLNNQVLGQYENLNTGIKNQEIMYNANVKDRQSVSDQQSREVFEQKYLGSLEAQRQQKLQSLDELYSRIAENKSLNRNANLLMKLAPAFNEFAEWNGYQYVMRPSSSVPPKWAIQDKPTKK